MCSNIFWVVSLSARIIGQVFLDNQMSPKLDEIMYKASGFQYLFKNEITAYEKLFPILGWTGKYPKYYYSENKDSNDAIALGDFESDGWKMSRALYNLSLDHIIAAVKQLGKFHGSAYSLKVKNVQEFEAIKGKFEEAKYRDATTYTGWGAVIITGPKRAIKAARNLCSNIPISFLNHLSDLLDDPYKYQMKKVNSSEPLAVLCHGDYLRTNIAFKYNENGEAIDALMFDFQTIRYGSPMIDLTTFIANSCGKELRSEYFNRIFEEYYSSLKLTYRLITEEDVPEYLSHDNLLREYAIYLPYGLSIASSLLMFAYKPFDEPWTKRLHMTDGDFIAITMERGGNVVDQELASLVMDTYDLHTRFNLNLS